MSQTINVSQLRRVLARTVALGAPRKMGIGKDRVPSSTGQTMVEPVAAIKLPKDAEQNLGWQLVHRITNDSCHVGKKKYTVGLSSVLQRVLEAFRMTVSAGYPLR